MSETFVRPNGKPYRPRNPKLQANAWENPGEECGVVILGTLDPSRAQEFADEMVAYWYDHDYRAGKPVSGWWRDGFELGQRAWLSDAVRGRPGVWFTAIWPDGVVA